MGGRRLQTVLLALCLILAAALALLVPRSGGEGREQEEEAPEMITDMDVSQVGALALVNGSGSVAIMVNEGQMELIDAPGEPSQSVMKAFLYRMAHMPAARDLGPAGNWEQYGLEDPSATVVLLDQQGMRVRLFAGDEAPFGAGRYLRREDDDRLYLVDGLTEEMLSYGPDDFRQLHVFPSFSADRFSQLELLRIQRGDDVLELQGFVQDGAVYFVLTQPFEVVLSWQNVVNELAAPVAALAARRVVSDSGDLARYGLLDEDAYRLTVDIASQETVLYFAPDGEDGFFCANAAEPTVVDVEGALAAFLDCDAFDLMDRSLYNRPAADADSVTVTAEGLRTMLQLSGEGTMLRGTYEGRGLDQAQTVALYQALTMLPPAETLDREQELTGAPALTLTVALKDGSVDVIELLPISDRRCAAVINGQAVFTTYTDAVREIVRAAEQALT